MQTHENFALRLKDSVLVSQNGILGRTPSIHSSRGGKEDRGVLSEGDEEDSRRSGRAKDASQPRKLFLDEEAYVAAATLRPGDDAYSRNKFNQAESDKLPSNRVVPDTRNLM